MSSENGTRASITSGPDRLALASECVANIRSHATVSGRDLNHLEQSALERAEAQLQKLVAQRSEKETNISATRSHEDAAFGDRFLEFFTSEAFSEDLDSLRQSEGSRMSESDFLTLAESIKTFGLGMSVPDKDALIALLDSRS